MCLGYFFFLISDFSSNALVYVETIQKFLGKVEIFLLYVSSELFEFL